MGWKETVNKGKRDFLSMIQNLEYEILALRDENMRLKKEIERLKGAKNGEP